ncbi:MAG: hypothetical protein V3V99_10580 [candidate division Zixibacteria bacterium]
MIISDIEKQKAIIKSTYLGLFMNVLGPAAIFFVAAFIKGHGFQSAENAPYFPSSQIHILFYALLFISIADFVAAYFIRKSFSSRPCPPDIDAYEFFTRQMVTISVVVYSLNLMHALYGLALYLLGAAIEIMMLFVALTFVSYQLFRPRKNLVDYLCKKIEAVD